MNNSRLFFVEPTKQLLQRLEAALHLYMQENWRYELPKLTVDWRQANGDRVAYVSAIALQAKALQIPAMPLAAEMATWLNQTTLTTEEQFTLQVVSPGLLRVELTDYAIAARLQNLTIYPPNLVNLQSERGTPGLFDVQYTHARCCSLLSLAVSDRLIALEKPIDTNSAAIFCVCAQDAIVFLDAQKQLLCSHAAEQALIVQLLSAYDRLDGAIASSTVDWKKIAVNLSHAWQKFYADCRIWGEVKQNQHLVPARLGLTLVTQTCLRLLLNDKLRAFAPQEL